MVLETVERYPDSTDSGEHLLDTAIELAILLQQLVEQSNSTHSNNNLPISINSVAVVWDTRMRTRPTVQAQIIVLFCFFTLSSEYFCFVHLKCYDWVAPGSVNPLTAPPVQVD